MTYLIFCKCRVKSEDTKDKLEIEVQEVRKERDMQIQECEELKVQLHLAEDRLENIHQQLHDTVRKLKDGRKFFSEHCVRIK